MGTQAQHHPYSRGQGTPGRAWGARDRAEQPAVLPHAPWWRLCREKVLAYGSPVALGHIKGTPRVTVDSGKGHSCFARRMPSGVPSARTDAGRQRCRHSPSSPRGQSRCRRRRDGKPVPPCTPAQTHLRVVTVPCACHGMPGEDMGRSSVPCCRWIEPQRSAVTRTGVPG